MKKSMVRFCSLISAFCFSIICLCSFNWSFKRIPEKLNKYIKSYPNSIRVIEYDAEKKDWKVQVNDVALYWAESRFLPEEELANRDEWRSHLDYVYSKVVFDPADKAVFTSSFVLMLKSKEFYKSRARQKPYHNAFYNALYNCSTRASVEQQITTISFLGHKLNIHKKLIPELKKIEIKIYNLKAQEVKKGMQNEYGTVQFFLSQLEQVQGYNWREVSDTSNRSQHSRGIAIDVLPKNWESKNIYWRWRADWDENWMLLALGNRWMPPADVVKAFESEGFIWGGNWVLWDTIHFEYRPELL
ncbi:MAG TPA: M15 family metallopeptidase [Treponemataceae bacterium]|nr:M15 family metallopeptidase [Treponemataceae bacterium]